MRLLVVEDEPRIAEVLRTALGRAGFVADTVATCADARATLAVNPYDAAILDLGLPDGDGLAVIGEARRTGKAIPILCSPRATRSRIAWPAWTRAPTIIWSSRLP